MFDLESVSQDILCALNDNSQQIANKCSLSSPRSVGDAVQEYLADPIFPDILSRHGIDVATEFGRRAMEDIAFKDSDNNYYAVDVKTHNLDTDFNMPNLISVKRLSTFYKNDDNNHFCILIVAYHVVDAAILFENCHFKQIESFSWDCLTIGALGWGQIQIANANNLSFIIQTCRKSWMLTLCDKLSSFYDEEIAKIGERKAWFSSTKSYWESK